MPDIGTKRQLDNNLLSGLEPGPPRANRAPGARVFRTAESQRLTLNRLGVRSPHQGRPSVSGCGVWQLTAR